MKLPNVIRVLLYLGIPLLIAAVGFLAWAVSTAPAEAQPLQQVRDEVSLSIVEGKNYIVLSPKNSSPTTGLLFYPGAKVDPEAYIAKLAVLVKRAKIVVVVGKPALNLAFFSVNQADSLKLAAPAVTDWYIGGHSLGGAMACQYLQDKKEGIKGLILFASYCAANISNLGLPVLSIAGANDQITTQRNIEENQNNLPDSAQFITIPGMNHAQFGDYGQQDGDGPSAVADEVAATAIANTVVNFLFPIVAP